MAAPCRPSAYEPKVAGESRPTGRPLDAGNGRRASPNVAWLALPTFGESWHHNHHAFARSARHGLGRFELDPSAMLIWTLEKLGLAKNVVRIAPERQAQKLVGAADSEATDARAAA